MRKLLAVMGLLLASLLLTYGVLWLATPVSQTLPTVEQTHLPEGLQIGRWLLTGREVPANWLGQKFQGKMMREPINVILVDEVAATPDAAVQYLLESCEAIGYLSRPGHSSDYRGQIGNVIYSQLPRQQNHAFSNAMYILPNNHGRIFGPHFFAGYYYFSGALSREAINLFAEVRHVYASFEMAKQDFAARMQASGRYFVVGAIAMENVFLPSESMTTGDHDGTAVLLRRGR
ncbi:MAG: hypothetical protein KAZ05_05470 [Negativicutes bacterium]|nr:hypothetical protein [Negativicutes bacterium]